MQFVCPVGTCKQPFTNAGNLAAHLKRRHPKPARRPQINSPHPENPISQEASFESTEQDQGFRPDNSDSDNDELDAFCLGSVLNSDEFDDLYEAAVHAEDGLDLSHKFDTNIELLLFLARAGLSATLQQDLLDLLHHKEFDPKQVCMGHLPCSPLTYG